MSLRKCYLLLPGLSLKKCISCLSHIHIPPETIGCLQRRYIFSKTGHWEKSFSPAAAKEIESYWTERTTKMTNASPVEDGKEKFYVLSMFPYPSGRLHMGHVRVYTISDVMARYHTMSGKKVIHPMGWDAFGLPAENAAIERGEAPDRWTYSNIKHMKKQLKKLGCNFDWTRELATCDPEYYRWTQYIFVLMFEAGLAYQKQASVNWDPVDGTVLADEQIDEEGRSWRSRAHVEKKYLRQWYLNTTAYAKDLLDGLTTVDESMWRDVTKLQRNWLGQCDGTRFYFILQCDGVEWSERLSVFTRSPEAIYGATFIALSPDHWLNQTQYHQSGEDGGDEHVMLRIEAVNPFNQETIPVLICQSITYDENNDSYLGIACVNEEDHNLARRLGLNSVHVLEQSGGETTLVQSGEFSGLSTGDAARAITQFARSHKFGGNWVSAKLNDWLISRQRYWGTPIPIIHCPSCKAVAVPFHDLPVKLPELSSSNNNTVSPLSEATEWKQAKCPKCGGPAERETDTMDTFVDSSWYFLRYLDPENLTRPFDPHIVNKYMPVDLYIGGKEHAVLHLYFARFFCQFLHEQGMICGTEPFQGLLTQGMVMGQSYRVTGTGRYLSADHIHIDDKTVTEKETGAPVVVRWEKMSKSKKNGVDPQDVLDEYGADSTRLCILSNVAPKSDRQWSPQAFVGILSWQNKLWTLLSYYIQHRQQSGILPPPPDLEQLDKNLFDSRNYHLKEVNFHLKKTYLLSVAISKLQSYTKDLRNKKYTPSVVSHSVQYELALADHIIMLAPFAPCFASEMWAGLISVPPKTDRYHWDVGVLEQAWPEVDHSYQLPLRMLVNDQLSEEIKLPREDLEQLTLESAHELAKLTPNYRTYVHPCIIGGLELDIITEHSATLKVELPEKRPKQVKHEES